MKLLILLTLLVGCTGTWQRRAVLAGGTAVILCDLSQTTWMNDNNKWDRGLHEGDPLLGSTHPSEGVVLAANLGSIALNAVAYLVLPARWGLAVNSSVFVVEGANVTTQPNPTHNGQPMPYAAQHHGCDVGRQL